MRYSCETTQVNWELLIYTNAKIYSTAFMLSTNGEYQSLKITETVLPVRRAKQKLKMH